MNDQRRQDLYNLLGELPSRSVPIKSIRQQKKVLDKYILEELTLQFDGKNNVEAYFIKPLESQGPLKTIIFNHSHGGDYELGKDELVNGNVYLQMPPYAEVLTEMGYAVFCFDAWGFGSRSDHTEDELFKEMLWNGEVLWGKMVYDSLRAIDYLTSRTDVDSEHIGTLGMSMGAVMAWWLAALDTRIKVCVDICGMVEFDSLIESRGLSYHGIYFYVPSLLKHFSTADINELIAPRPHLCLAGNNDDLTPRKGLDIVDEKLTAIYKDLNKEDSWKMVRSELGHEETEEMREKIKLFLQKWL